MLNTDHQGFILGELRLKQIRDGVENTHENTEKILDFLKAEMRRMSEANQAQSYTLNKTVQDYIKQNKKAKDSAKQSNGANAQPSPNTSNTGGSGRARPSRNADSNAPSSRPRPSRDAEDPNPNPTRRTRTRSQAEERAEQERERSSRDRDSKGRFTAKDKTILDKFKDLLKSGGGSGGNVDTKGYDPTVDAVNELKELVSPVSNIFGKMTSRAIGVFRGRMRKNRNEETLPEEQQQANRREHESGKERNKLLKRLIDAVRAKSNGGGLFGGLFGGLGKLFKGGKGLFKGLLKRIPLLGLLFGGASLFSEWGKLDSGGKGKGIGGLAGGALGAILGSALGPLGTIGGGMLGAYLGGIFGEKVGKWTDSLENSDFAGIFKSLWSDLINKMGNIIDGIANSKIVKNTKEAIGNGFDYIKQGASSLYKMVTGNKTASSSSNSGGSSSSSGTTGRDLLSYGQGGGTVASNGGLKDEGTQGLGIYKPIADAVAKYESKGSYTIANTGGYEKRRVKGDFKTINEANLTKMSINDILARNALPVGDPKRLNAVGRYQIIASNLRNWVKDGSLKGTDIFTPELQDKLFLKLLPKSAKDYAKGKNVSIAKVQNDIAGQWAAVPRSDTGRSAHEGTGLNKANPNAGGLVVDAMNQIRSGKPVEPSKIANQSPAVQSNTKGKDVIPLPTQTANINNKSKMVTPKSSKDLATFAQNAEVPLSNKAVVPSVTPKTKSILQMNRMQSSNIGKVQPIAAERTPLNSKSNTTPVMTAQAQDSNINQNVSDRGLAHIFSGGIGFKTLQG